ncbi:thiamine pyrophosphate-dependent enzyme [Acidobacteriota bacterium]
MTKKTDPGHSRTDLEGFESPTHYCPGCSHGIVERIMLEAFQSLGMKDHCAVILGAGCAIHADGHLKLDLVQAAPGMAPAVATGLKRTLPDRLVICYQGDADLYGRGLSPVLQAASRGETFTLLCLNNRAAGYAEGRVSPSTPIGMKLRGAATGRTPERHGYPLDLLEIIQGISGVVLAERVVMDSPKKVKKASSVLKKALESQKENRGLSYIELVGVCPTGWGLSPVDAVHQLAEEGKTPSEIPEKP